MESPRNGGHTAVPERESYSDSSSAGISNILGHLGRLFDVTHDLLAVLGYDDRLKFMNSSWETTLGYSCEEMMSISPTELVHPDDRAATHADIEKVLAGKPTTAFQNRFRCKDGSYRWLSWSSVASPSEQCFYLAARDITEYKRFEERAIRLASALENSGEMICMADENGLASFVNKALLEATGFREDEILGKMFHQTVASSNNPPELEDEIRNGVIMKGRWQGEILQRCKNGLDMPVSLSLSALRDKKNRITGVFGISQDISERRELEERLRRAQKMEAVGQLAGGIAHDFNNLLMVIMGYAGDLTERLDEADPLRRKAEEICRAGRRAASLTRQLLAFSRQQVLSPQVLSLNTVVNDLHTMLERVIGENVQLVSDLAADLGSVKADQGQMEQVIVNLVVNARDAMPDGGKVTLQSSNFEVDGAFARLHPEMSPGSYVRLTVTDTGTGMDAGTQARIFEPFFTTKERGKGTGLGLATVYGVVKQSSGFIWVYSELGKGSTFEVLLPRVRIAAEPPRPAMLDRRTARPARTETILLVEDDEALRELVVRSLKERGCTVLSAANGNEALVIAEERASQIDLMVTDVVMPGMSGPQVADRIVADNPQLRVLYMSGYPEFAAKQEELLKDGRQFLQKPHTLSELARKIDEMLEGRPAEEMVVIPS